MQPRHMDKDTEQVCDPDVTALIQDIGFLKHLRDEISENPQAYQIRSYKRGEIVDRDSNQSDWVYYIKSGSVSVLKKLKAVQPKSFTRSQELSMARLTKERQKSDNSDEITAEAILSKPDVAIYNSTYEMEKRLEQTLPGYLNHADRLGVVPYDTIVENHRQRVRRKTTIDVPSLSALPADDIGSCDDEADDDFTTPVQQKTSISLPPIRLASKGSYFSNGAFNERSRRRMAWKDSTDYDVNEAQGMRQARQQQQLSNSRRKKSLARHLAKVTPTRRKAGDNSIFLSVQVLEKGEYFGLNSLLRKDQPSLSLVSNGSECMLISKRFLHHHLDHAFLNTLRATEHHYPRSAVMQRKVQDLVNWTDGRQKIYSQLVYDKRSKIDRRRQFHPQFMGEYCFRTGPE